jgi:hypothetical protein
LRLLAKTSLLSKLLLLGFTASDQSLSATMMTDAIALEIGVQLVCER